MPPYQIDSILGPYKAKEVESMLAFPYNHGSTVIRYKLFPGILDERGHTQKYFQPKDSKPALYIPPESKGLDNAKVPLWILEGEKKTLRWWQEGFRCCVGIAGAWNWSDSYSLYPRLIEDFDKIKLDGRVVNVIVDSDYLTNRNVQLGYLLFVNSLLRRRARVDLIVIPSGKDGQKVGLKVGLDDFLQSNYHTAKDVLRLPKMRITLEALRRFEVEFPKLTFPNDWLHDVLNNGVDPDVPPSLHDKNPFEDSSGESPFRDEFCHAEEVKVERDFRKIPIVKSIMEYFGEPEHKCRFYREKTNFYAESKNAWYEGGHPEHTVKCPACALEKAKSILSDLYHNFQLGFYYLLMPKKAEHDSLRREILKQCKEKSIVPKAAKLVSKARSKKIILSPVSVDPRMRFVTWEDKEMLDLLLPFLECDPDWKKGEHQFDGWGDFDRQEKRIKGRRGRMKGTIHLQLNCSPEQLTKTLEAMGEKPVRRPNGSWGFKLSKSTLEWIQCLVRGGDPKRVIPSTSVWHRAKVLNDGGLSGS